MIKKLLFCILILFSFQNAKSQTLDLLVPSGSENWAAGSLQAIQWSYNNINFIKIEYSIDGGLNYYEIISSTNASDNQYLWTVPDSVSNNCKIRITDYNSVLSDQNQNPFNILFAPYIGINSPNGGEVLTPGNTTTISWTDTLISNAVKIEYSGDNGLNWVLIDDNYPNSNSFLWTIPNTPSNYCLVRISDVQNGTLNDFSDNYFTIIPIYSPLNLLSPNGGEIWANGYQQNIYWTADTIANIKIEISYDLGTTWIVLENTYPTIDGYYPYIVNAPYATTNALIKISDVLNPSVFDESNFPFEVFMPPPVLNLITPNGGETIAMGLITTIVWNAINVNALSIEYSINNGLSWNVITNNTSASTGSFDWTVPNLTSDSVLIKISDISNAAITDQSTSNFSIISPQLEFINFPNGVIFEIYSNFNIFWSGIGINNQLLKLEYSTNNGSSWTTFATDVINSGAYSWLINCPPADSCKIKISLQNNPSVFAISSGSIKIVAFTPSIVVLTPSSQEILGAGNIYAITWFSYAVNYVRIEYSLNGDTTFTLITPFAPALNGVYYWQVPANINAINCKIRISNAANTALSAENPFVFSIQQGFYTITSGNASNSLVGGFPYQIEWTYGGVGNYVNIAYSTDNLNWITVVNNYPNTGDYTWTLPFINSNTLWYKVSDAVNSAIYDICNQPQNISIASPFLELSSPSSGSILETNTDVNINWLAAGVDFIKIEYSTDNGTNWTTVADNISSSSTNFLWNLPATPIANGILKISNAANPLLFDQIYFSSANPYITVTMPNGGENLNANNPNYITWQSVGVSHVNLYYSDNNGVNWTTIDSNRLNLNYYNWQTLNAIGNNYKIKVENSDAPFIVDESNAVFSIITPSTSIVLNYPNGGEQLTEGTGIYITWQATNITNIDLSYSIDGGTTYTPIATNYPGLPSFYFWQVPDTITNTVRVKINKTGNSAVSDFSLANFSIHSNIPSIQVTYPNGGETFNANSYRTIKWHANNCNYVKIYYSVNGGATYTYINSIVNDSTFIWNVPQNVSTNCIIKIESGNDAAINDNSNSTFEITTIPSGGYVLTVDSLLSNQFCSGSNLVVNFTVNNPLNSSNNFRVHLSNNSGTFNTFTDIGGITATNSGSINCTIPGQIASGTNYSLRIVSDNPPLIGNYYFGNITIHKADAEFTSNKLLAILPDATVEFTPLANTNMINSSNWTVSNGTAYTTYTAQTSFSQPGNYNVNHTITDTNGCSATVLVNRMIRVEHLFYTDSLNNQLHENLVDIAFENEKYGCAIFENENCLVTADSGKTWSLAYTANNNVRLNAVAMQNNNWYITLENGNFLKSTDKGSTWSQITFNNNEALNDIQFVTPTLGYTIGNSGKIFKFNGTLWQNELSGTYINLNKIGINNSTKVIVGDAGTILKLQNNVWVSIASPVNVNLNDIMFTDSLSGFIAADFGYILKTADAGLTWSVANSGADVNFNKIACSADSIWSVGTAGIIYVSYTNGASWKRNSIGKLDNLNGIFYAKNKGFIVGQNGLLRSFNTKKYIPLVDNINEEANELHITCYPNPSTHFIKIKMNSYLSHSLVLMQITDINGRVITNHQFNFTIGNHANEAVIDIKNLKSGLYFLNVITDENHQTCKIIKTD